MAEVNEPAAGGERAGEGLGGEVLRYVGVGDAMTQIAANLNVVALEHFSEHHGIVPGRCHRSCNARHAAEVPADVSWLCMASRGPYASYFFGHGLPNPTRAISGCLAPSAYTRKGTH